MDIRDFTGRLTGLSTPFGGAAWAAQPTDRDLAHRVITFLEDRRVLYTPDEAEVPEHCVRSVLEIRREVTEVLADAHAREPLTGQLRAIRAACRKFVDYAGTRLDEQAHSYSGGFVDWRFNQALGELRGVVGIHVALLADRHGLSVENDLASILPAAEDDAAWLFDKFPLP